GNIVTGTELIRRKANGEAFALTCPLMTKSDGTKFGKTESGTVWLDPKKTSPYQFYQFWLNASDQDVSKFIRIFTLFSKEKIEALEQEHAAAPHLRILQKALAEDITIRVHSEEELDKALEASEVLFGKGEFESLKGFDEHLLLQIFEGLPNITISRNTFEETQNPTDLLSTATNLEIFPSKTEAKKMIMAGGVSINKNKVGNFAEMPTLELLHDKYFVVQKGKKNYYLVVVD
ncbi:MAG: tyrosine--tRNA ligase, partial [Cytophagales bacterium]|nr:tyrosine--tRNA ligase [Cytophagales bacterium]